MDMKRVLGNLVVLFVFLVLIGVWSPDLFGQVQNSFITILKGFFKF